MFIPTTKTECQQLNWQSLDIILLTGDAYIDSSFVGVAVIGKYLIKNGFRVGIISQPKLDSSEDLLRLGEPNLFWGITAGAMDSMVANYTATKKKRRQDDLTPGGDNVRRPNRATIRYANLVKQYSRKPVVLGGLEASLRRLAHYDFWDDSLRKSVLLDAKADILVYGEGERTVVELANFFRNINNNNVTKSDIINTANLLKFRGICFLANAIEDIPKDYIRLPDYAEVVADKMKFKQMFEQFYQNNEPLNANGLLQKFDTNRYVVQTPPNYYLEGEELDLVYDLDYENDAHPACKNEGKIVALDTTRFSITTHRGCFGECNFCAIAVHFGRKIRSRSASSILSEIKRFADTKHFKGNINDMGGASANMYKMECAKQNKFGSCKDKRCLFPAVCKSMNINHFEYLQLIKDALNVPKVKKVFLNSGLRYDLVQYDKESGDAFMQLVVGQCVSGQMKIAPEHIDAEILQAMGKPKADLLEFVTQFNKISKKHNKRQFLTYYLMAGHPNKAGKFNGDVKAEVQYLKSYFSRKLKVTPEQIQVFTPTPSTYSTLMYYLAEKPENAKNGN